MSQGVAVDICRVTVVGPRTRVDLALPVNVPFAELFQGIAHFAGLDAAAIAEAPEGWALQRLGEPPFEPTVTPAQAGVADGELLYLRPWVTALPPVASDDIADEIAGVHDGPGRWGPRDGRRVALGAGAAALAAGVLVLLRAGPPWPVPAMSAGLLAVLLLAAGAAVSRAAGDAGAGAVLGYAALPYAFAAGVLAPLRALPLTHVSALAMLAGLALVMTAALIGGTAVAHGIAVFFGVAAAAAFGIAGAALACLWPGLTAAGAAGLVAAPALALTPLIPAAAFRLARLPLPPVPASAEDLRDDAFIAGAGVDVRSRARAADQFVTGAVSGLGLLGASAGIVLALGPGGLAPVMCAALSCALLLRSRVFRGRAQRLWLVIPGYVSLTWLAVVLAGRSMHIAGPDLLALVAATVIVVGVGIWLPAHRPSPFWGRAADVCDTAMIISLVPLALGVAGTFGYLHGLGG
jgi:type VII secretion integral membrane protein EccD